METRKTSQVEYNDNKSDILVIVLNDKFIVYKCSGSKQVTILAEGCVRFCRTMIRGKGNSSSRVTILAEVVKSVSG